MQQRSGTHEWTDRNKSSLDEMILEDMSECSIKS
jgi:hypothetical protein